jgi:iron uptake system component EfeO
MSHTTVRRPRFRAAASLSVVVLLGLAASACGSGNDVPANAPKLSFQLTDAGCQPHDAAVAAGPVVFEVENAGTSKVSEFEILEGDSILGEKEDLSDGLSGSFSLTLEKGSYTIYCPGGSQERGTLTVR